jgi:hypothetical protein
LGARIDILDSGDEFIPGIDEILALRGEEREPLFQLRVFLDRHQIDGTSGSHRIGNEVEIRRQTCTWMVPFVTIKARDGSWLVTQVDLAAAGNPARPCIEGPGEPSSQN